MLINLFEKSSEASLVYENKNSYQIVAEYNMTLEVAGISWPIKNTHFVN